MAHYFRVAARLKPGITQVMANTQLKLAADEFRRIYPNALGPQSGFTVMPLHESMVGGRSPAHSYRSATEGSTFIAFRAGR